MKKLLLIFLLSFPAIAFAQMYGGGHFSRVTDSATYVNDAAVAACHSAGYADIFYSTASDLWWKWNGTDYELIGSGSSSSGGSVNTFAPNVQTGNYTLVQLDTTRLTLMRSTGAQNLTIPAGMKVGSTFPVTQDSTGTTTLVLDGVSADNASGTLTCSQDEAVTIYYKDVDNVIIYKSGASAAGVIGAQDLFITAAAMWPTATNGSSTLTTVEMATSLFNIQSLDFDQSQDENAQFQVSLPRNWNNGTVTFTVYWTATAGTGTVQWEINGASYANDDPLTGAAGTAVVIDDTLIATNDLHISPTSSAMTFSNTPADGDFLMINIMRDVSDDDLSADAKLLGVRVTLTLDASTSE
jgi:hypothetical protein